MRIERIRFWSKCSLTVKILAVFLALSVTSLAFIGILASINIRGISTYAIDTQVSLGNQAVSESTEALENQAKEALLRLVKDQAALSNTIFEKIGADLNLVSAYASSVWSNPLQIDEQSTLSSNEMPLDPYAASVYLLAPGVDFNSVAEEVSLSRKMDELFKPLLADSPELAWIYIGTESGILRLYPWTDDVSDEFDPRDRTWYQHAVQTGKTGWTELYVDAGGQGLTVTCSRPIYDNEDRLIGVAAVDVTLETVNERIISTQVGDLGYGFLIDEYGDVVARPGLSPGDKRWDESFTTENMLESSNQDLRTIAFDMTAGNSGVAEAMFDDGEKYVAYAPITSTGWSIGLVMPVGEIIAPAVATGETIAASMEAARVNITQQIERTQTIFILVFLVLILTVIGLAFWLAKTISKPILSITAAAQSMEKGTLSEEDIARLNQSQGEDEVATLSRVFAKMAVEVEARETRLKKHVEELRIEIDHSKRARQVAEITDTDYFQYLKKKAKEMRNEKE